MTLKEWFNSKQYWLRGLIIGGIVGLLILPVSGFLLGMCWSIPGSFSCSRFEAVVNPLAWMFGLIPCIIGLIIGSLIGLITGKIKSKRIE